jgi:acetyl-CoA carboxylase carboxyl transferase subunit alpha
MMRFAWYSVISPEGCAAILWKTGEKAAEAAKALKLTAPDNLALGTIDEVIEEPLGGAHRHPHAAGDRLERWLLGALRDLQSVDVDELLRRRYEKLRKIGSVAGV